MPTANYRLFRDDPIRSLFTHNRPSTDATAALFQWRIKFLGREEDVLIDEDDALEVILTWNEADELAEVALDNFCRKFGVAAVIVDPNATHHFDN